MTHIEQAIKEAVEKGGYRLQDIGFTKGNTGLSGMYMEGEKVVIGARREYPLSKYSEVRDGGFWVHYTQITSDPAFWQTLGKARGWDRKMFCAICDNGIGRDSDDPFQEEWQHQWHRFIDHLAKGKDIESFFADLLTNRK